MAGEDTPESLGLAITRVLKDHQLRARIANGGHRFVREHHDRRRIAANLCSSYVRLVQKTRRWKQIAARPVPAALMAEVHGDEDQAHQQSGFAEAEIHASA
jgi:predicted RNA polymerase sigma factor